MTRARPRHRPGYTLLELLLATLIAVMLLGALYTAMEVTLTQMDASREQVQVNDLSRAVINRMASDLSSPLGPLQPKSGGGTSSTMPSTAATGTSESASSSTSTGSTSGQTGTTAGGTVASGTGASTGSTAAATDTTTGIADDASSPDAQAALAADVPLQAGVIGTATQLTLYASRTPPALTDPDAAANPDVLQPSDQRRVTYYLGTAGGLCRQERPWVTADGVRNSAEPDYSTEAADVIAPEVVDVVFEYFDGGAWLPEWDGSVTATDGKSATGPPRAVRVTLTFQYPGRGTLSAQKVVSHVFPVRAAVGAYQPPIDEPTAETESGTSGTSTTTTTGGM